MRAFCFPFVSDPCGQNSASGTLCDARLFDRRGRYDFGFSPSGGLKADKLAYLQVAAPAAARVGYGLDQIALDAARATIFEPGSLCGKPIVGTKILPFRFELQ